MTEITKDDLEFQKGRIKRLNQLKELKVPNDILQIEEMISKMTLSEYEIYLQNLDEEDKKIKSEYAKNNPIQKSIVDEIYSRESKLEYGFFIYTSSTHFLMAVDPLDFMSMDDFEHDIYGAFLDHAQELYRARYSVQFKKDYRENSVV